MPDRVVWGRRVLSTTISIVGIANWSFGIIKLKPAGPFEKIMRHNDSEIEEKGTENYALAEAAADAALPSSSQVRPLGEELCRLLAKILARALQANQGGILTTSASSLQSWQGE